MASATGERQRGATERVMQKVEPSTYARFLERYRAGEPRSRIFHDLVLEEILARQEAVVLDIGCGRGFDADPRLSTSLASHAKAFLGVEPDRTLTLQSIFSEVYHTPLEEAPIGNDKVDVAFCVMVLEHIERPEPFMKKIFEVLRGGGVFWGFTVDARHWFPKASRCADVIHAKELYLRLTHGERGLRRYENYPVHYRMNKPRHFEAFDSMFRSSLFLNFYRPGQIDFYYPRGLRWFGHAVEAVANGLGVPGSILAIRLQK